MFFAGRRTSVLAILAAALILAAPASASAFSLFGINLFGDEQADADAVIAEPQPYTISFEIAGSPKNEDAIRNASTLWSGRDRPASGSAGLLASARADYARLVAVLYEQGFFGATVTIAVDGRQATTLPPDAGLGNPATVAVRVDTGPRFRYGDIRIGNAPPGWTNEGLVQGQPASATGVRTTAALAVEQWRSLGYPKAGIASQEIVADHTSNRLNVSLEIEPGRPATIGEISVEGNEAVDRTFIAHASGLEPGRVYSPRHLADSRARLAELDTFNVIKIEEAETISPDGSLPLTIVVQERKPRRVGVGATYSTTDGAGVEAFWLHRNLFGQAERLRVDAKVGGIHVPATFADLDYYLGLSFIKPAILTADTDFTATATAQRTLLARYTETSVEATTGISHRLFGDLRAAAGIAAKQANFLDPAFGERNFTLVGAYANLTYDTRDNKTDPTEGFYASLDVEPFYEAIYDNSAVRLEGEARTYFSFDPESNFVLAGRVKVGALLGPSIAETPPDKLFFSGGGGSVRGFPFRSIGVDGPGGTIVGGKFLTEASIEARVKFTPDIGATAFVDAGYVTDTSFVGLDEGTRIGGGVGLRYYTGLGPLRLDLAFPVNRRPGDPDYALYVGIGQAF